MGHPPTPARAAPPPTPSCSLTSTADHVSLRTSAIRFQGPFLFFQGKMHEGRTDHRAALDTSRQAAKNKTCPRWLVGNPAHARTSCALTIHDPRQRACSLRHRKPREVALQQPKVAAQLPSGGDVSTPCPCGAWRFSDAGAGLDFRAGTDSKAAPEGGLAPHQNFLCWITINRGLAAFSGVPSLVNFTSTTYFFPASPAKLPMNFHI